MAPGFIDVLSYEPNPYGVWYKLGDGVTTNLAIADVSLDPSSLGEQDGLPVIPIGQGLDAAEQRHDP